MKTLFFLLTISILGMTASAAAFADEHGGVHIMIPGCEDANEEGGQQPVSPVCMELKPWYHHQHFDDYEDIEEQAGRLQDDTAWPGQREEFSDYLMR